MAEIILTPEDYIKELDDQKKALANNLVEKGIEANENEKFNTLVPKVLAIPINVGLPIEVSTEEEMTALLVNGELNGIYKYVGETRTYENGALYELTEEESDPLQGTWVWNDTLNPYPSATSTTSNARPLQNVNCNLSFICNNVNYTWFQLVEPTVINGVYYHSSLLVYVNGSGWKDQAYKTIEITSSFEEISVSGFGNYDLTPEGFLSWLQSNATKQVSKQFTKLILKTDLEEITINENGEYSGEYSNITVDVPIPEGYIVPTGTLQITANGEYDVTEYANTKVNVEDSPIPIEVSTEEEMNELLTSGEIGSVYKYIGTTGTYEKYALYILKNTSTFTSSDGYYITDAEGTILVPKGDIEIVKLSDREDLTTYFEKEYTTVDLPYAVRLKNYAFCKDTTLNYINIPCLVYIGDGAFEGCTGLALTELPSGIRYIGNDAFRNCSNLALTELPSGLAYIGNSAFYGCSNLALTELPSGIRYIGNDAFRNCSNLALTELPSGIRYIEDSAFYGCSNLALTELPSGLVYIGGSAFRNCSNLALTELPSGITSIDSSAFEGCTGLALTELPSGIRYISWNAFYGCSNLALTELPSGIRYIENSAFRNCSNLALTKLPSGIRYIRDSAFYGCSNLALTELPSGLVYIEDSAFRNCSNLALTELPSGIRYIEDSAFEGCTSLTNLTFKSKVYNIYSNAFTNCSNLLTINVPWAEGEVENAPWGATNATINYNYTEE